MSLNPHTGQTRADEAGTATTAPTQSTDEILEAMQAVVGRKWHPIIVAHLARDGPTGFSALKRSVEGLSSKMLSESLDDLEALGIVEREITNQKPVRVEYALTEAGRELEPLVAAMQAWGREHADRLGGSLNA